MISLNTHGILDYAVGGVLALSPVLLGFSDIVAARNVFLVLGLGLIAYSLFTNYRYSVAKLIPVGAHMALDVSAGVALMISPWLFGYSEAISGATTSFHFIMGLGALALVALTNTRGRESRSSSDLSSENSPIRRIA